ncbi:MAG: hypothetical protein ABIN01_23080 [Ferruginibacter sp.]
MKKAIKILLVVILVAALGGLTYWQYYKKGFIKKSIEKAITKKTDSLYYLHYDSSFVDELNGNATFYNVVLQSDSAQKQLLNSTDSLPNALYNIRIEQVTASGVDIVGLLQKDNVSAKKIVLFKPVIQIINTGSDNPKTFTMKDTLELYQKILGKFESIKADTIRITNGTLLMTNKTGKAQTTFENINISLNNFLVDSTKDYQSIVSYFIKDVRVTVENVQLPTSKNNTRINLEKVDYNANKRYLHIASVKQYLDNNMNPVIDLKKIQVNELNTDAFILQQRLKAGQISCDGGVVTIYVKKNADDKKASRGKSLELSSDIIDQAQVGGINLGSTKIIIADKSQPGKPPFILNNARFKLTKMLKIDEGASINNIINNAEWELSANGFSFNTNNKMYKISVGNFVINTATSIVKINNFLLKPLLTEQQFVKQSRHQNDQYNFTINDIILSGVNTKKLLINEELEVDKASFQPILKIYNDRTLPPGTESKVGKYPFQSLLKLSLPVYIRTATIQNASVFYRERALKSKLIGNVFFNNINATLANITNMPDRIKANPLLKLNATAKFLNAGNVSTEWRFPLNDNNGAFSIKGQLKDMDALALNSIIEPLAMASIKSGHISEVEFTINGTDTKGTGNILFLYEDLKLNILKKGDEAELKKKGLVSLFANTLIKNDNTSRSNSKDVIYDRDITKSFFNLVWKTIFTGAKNTAIGKK